MGGLLDPIPRALPSVRRHATDLLVRETLADAVVGEGAEAQEREYRGRPP